MPTTATRRQIASHGAFQLSYKDVATLLHTLSLTGFVTSLMDAMDQAYADLTLKTVKRAGYTARVGEFIDTLEYMGCRAHDYGCMKLISSNPSVAEAGIPVVTGTMICTDSDRRYLDQASLICDTALLTPIRTATGTVAVLRRVKPRVATVGIVGAGLEGTAHAFVIAAVLPSVDRIVFMDISPDRARIAAEDVRRLLDEEGVLEGRSLDILAVSADELEAVTSCEALVTATYANEVVLDRGDVRDGTFIAAVGADLEGKRELGDALYEEARFVADDLRQCLTEGELQYAADVIRVRPAEVASLEGHTGRLAEGRIISVRELLREAPAFLQRSEPIVIYDSTGFSGQDLAVARVLLAHLGAKRNAAAWNPPRRMSFRELWRASADASRRRRRGPRVK